MSDRVRWRRASLVITAVFVCSLVGSAGVALAASPSPSTGAAPGDLSVTPPKSSGTHPSADAPDSWISAVAPVSDHDGIAVRIDVAPNGTADWYIEYRYELPSEAAVEGFRQASKQITNPPGQFIERIETNVVADAENATGRAMRLQQGQVETDLDVTAGEGSVIYRFTWTNFVAKPADDRLVVGDAMGRYDLGPNESLMIEWPDRLSQDSVSPAPDFSQAKAVRWVGPLEFRTEDPTVRLRVAGGGTGGLPVVPLVLVLGLLAVVGVGWYGRSRWLSGDTESEGVTAAVGASEAEAGDASGSGGSGDAATDTPAELLSDEERVLRLLEERGGRMKQQNLISAMDWSRTKASDVVNEMHRAEQIEVFRLGRENVLALPGEIEI